MYREKRVVRLSCVVNVNGNRDEETDSKEWQEDFEQNEWTSIESNWVFHMGIENSD